MKMVVGDRRVKTAGYKYLYLNLVQQRNGWWRYAKESEKNYNFYSVTPPPCTPTHNKLRQPYRKKKNYF
jgi:hypothetical protein